MDPLIIIILIIVLFTFIIVVYYLFKMNDRNNHKHIINYPYFPYPIGGCAGTRFGCCPDGITARNISGSNCLKSTPDSCAKTRFGCCPDGQTSRFDAHGSNCTV